MIPATRNIVYEEALPNLMRKFVFLLSTFFLLCAFAAAQTQPTDSDADKEKKKKEQDERVMKMLDHAVDDASALRLPQNRAVVFAMSADLYWKFDEIRARELFRNSADEIIAYLQALDKEHREDPDSIGDSHDYDEDEIRSQILPLAAKHDGELALNMLLNTRPAKLADAMARRAQPSAKPISEVPKWDPDGNSIQKEITLEQRFALLAADDNPDRAVKMIKDSLAKGISPNVLALLQKLNKKDAKKASELATAVVKKIVDSDIEKSPDDMRTAMDFLQYAFKPDSIGSTALANNAKDDLFKFTDAQGKDLAGKIADVVLQPSRTMRMASVLSQVKPLLEKFLPEKTALIKQREAEIQGSMPPDIKEQLQRDKMWDENTSAEDLLAQIVKNSSDAVNGSMYYALSRKMGQIDDEARLKKLIDQIPDEKFKAKAQEQLEAAHITHIANDGKLDDARKLIGNLTKKSNQIKKLVALAIEFQKKGGEKDIANAKSLMKDAKALTNDLADNDDDIGDLMEVVKGYATVDPDAAFRMFETAIDPMNDYIQARSVVNTYEKLWGSWPSAFRKGELKMTTPGPFHGMPIFTYIPQMQMLGKADLERMNSLADHFSRPESRLIVNLYVLQGFLKEDKKQDDPKPTGN